MFDPVALARTPEDARGLARDLTVATGAGQSAGDQEFWSSLSAKLLAPLLLAANRAGGSIATVQSWVDRREFDEPLAYLEHDGADALVASFSRDDRTLGSVLATVEAAIEPLSEGGDAIDPARLLEAANTCYLAAPLHDQRRYRPMFSGVVRQVLAEAARRAERGTPSGLLVLLDEAASIAPLEELDQVAATCQGQGVTLGHRLAGPRPARRALRPEGEDGREQPHDEGAARRARRPDPLGVAPDPHGPRSGRRR